MKHRRLTILVALVLALLGTGGLLAYVNSASDRALAGMKAVTTLVASQQIPAGTSVRSALSQGMLSSQRLPASSVPADAVHTISSGLGSLVLASAVQPGQLLLRSALVTAGTAAQTGTLAIPKGMVAVTLPLCLPAEVAGYVQPGSQVAVFDSYGAKGGNVSPNCGGTSASQSQNVQTSVVLPRVEVISVGSHANSSSSQNGSVMVTFAVGQDDAERLISLTQGGVPYLALLTPTSQVSYSAVVPQLIQP